MKSKSRSPHPTSRYLVAVLLSLALASAAQAASYYVDASAGSDSNSGTSPSAPWKSIAKVNKVRFLPGDQVLFKGGQTHAGNLAFAANDSGTAASPVTVSSYGTGRAAIYAAAGDGIKLSGTSHMILTDLDVAGPGWNAANDGSRGVVLAGSAASCEINNLTVSGFHKAGVRTESNTHDNTIAFVRAEQNGYIGIHISGTNQLVSDCQAISNNGDLTVTNNWSGSGILASDASFITIQYCEAASNGAHQPWTGNGPVGIWCWDSDHVVIRRCISHHNLRGKGNADGGGFDLDGGTTDSVIEYCYSYGNAGAGYLLYNFNWQSIPHRNNTVRYCVSENDKLGGIAIGTSGLPIENLAVHNNVCFNTNGSIVIKNYNGTVTNVSLRNNVFLTSGTLGVGNNAFILQGNCYYSTAGAYNFGSYGSNFAGWANATGKEKYNGQIVGLNLDPGLLDVGNGTKLTDPRELPTLRSYSPASGYAPVINAGLDLQALFGIIPGAEDLIGAPAPNGAWDIGAYEYQGSPLEDAVPPTVVLTAPADGAIVTGASVPVSASASDNAGGSGVAGVQFQLNGANLGAEDTTAPYAITWNTTTVANGAYTLTAVARDAAGNTATAASVTVTVDNVPVVEIVMDNADASGVTITGAWTASTSTGGYYGGNYLHDGNAAKGAKSVRFTPNLPSAGTYEVLVRWTSHSNRASNVPIDVVTPTGVVPLQVNQQLNGGQWVSLGAYAFDAGADGSVLISNAGTNGYVIADAVKFVKQ